MPKLLEELVKREFVIDESCEDTLDAAEALEASSKGPSAEARAPGDEAVPDLLSQIAGMLLDQERLMKLAEELRTRGQVQSTEDFVRFFRGGLPLFDSFDHLMSAAANHAPTEEVQNWLKSLAAIQSRMTDLYGRYGLLPMDPVGKPVNLDRHEVVEVIHTDSIPDETVVEVRQRGYIFDGRVLRDARVVVAKSPSQ